MNVPYNPELFLNLILMLNGAGSATHPQLQASVALNTSSAVQWQQLSGRGADAVFGNVTLTLRVPVPSLPKLWHQSLTSRMRLYIDPTGSHLPTFYNARICASMVAGVTCPGAS